MGNGLNTRSEGIEPGRTVVLAGCSRDDSRVTRCLYRKQVGDGVYWLDEGALLDDFFHFLHELRVVDWLDDVQSTAIQRLMVPCVQCASFYGLKTLYGVESINALPALLFSDEALMRLVGCNAQQVRQGVCQRGSATCQGPRTEGAIAPDARGNMHEIEVTVYGWTLIASMDTAPKTSGSSSNGITLGRRHDLHRFS